MKYKIPLGAAVLVILAVNARAQMPIDGSHYPIGLEGIKGGSLPSQGISLQDYNYFYYGTGNELNDFKTFVYMQAPQLTWMTPWKILGINYGMGVMIPVVYKHVYYKEEPNVTFGGHPAPPIIENENRFGLGDVEIEPLLLSCHSKHFDFSGGYSLWTPTGDYHDSSFVNLGNGNWTHMIMLGGVWYIDHNRTWAFSVLNHFEFNSQIPGVSYDVYGGHGTAHYQNIPCSVYDLEWGISKTIFKTTDVGVVGYYQEQFTDTSNASTPFDNAQVAAIGPEIRSEIPHWGLSVSLRYEYEYIANYHPKGNTVVLTLAKQF